MPRDSAGKILAKMKGYFGENWGAPFVIGFMVLLIVAASSLAIGLDFLANEVAIYAYYALVAGVVLQMVSFRRQQKKSEKARDEE